MPSDVAAATGAASVLAGAAMCTVDPISGLTLIASGCNFLGAEARNRRLESNCETMKQLHEARETENSQREQANLDRAKEVRALAFKMSGSEWEKQERQEFAEKAVAESVAQIRASEGRVTALQTELGTVREELLLKETQLASAHQRVKQTQNEAAAIATQAREKLVKASEQVAQKQQWSAELSKRLSARTAELEAQRNRASTALHRANQERHAASREAAMLRGELARLQWQRRAAAVICIGAAAYGAYRFYRWWQARQPDEVMGVPVVRENELEVGEIVEEAEQRERSEFERSEEEQRSELFILAGYHW